jgi:hypothetical protein
MVGDCRRGESVDITVILGTERVVEQKPPPTPAGHST